MLLLVRTADLCVDFALSGGRWRIAARFGTKKLANRTRVRDTRGGPSMSQPCLKDVRMNGASAIYKVEGPQTRFESLEVSDRMYE